MMKPASVQTFVKLRASLLREKNRIEARLTEINAAFEVEAPAPLAARSIPESTGNMRVIRKRRGRKAGQPMSPETKAKIAEAQRLRWEKKGKRGAKKSQRLPAASKGGRTKDTPSLRQTILALVKGKPLTRKELLQAVQTSGYQTKSKNLGNLLAPFLYGKRAILKKVDGRFRAK